MKADCCVVMESDASCIMQVGEPYKLEVRKGAIIVEGGQVMMQIRTIPTEGPTDTEALLAAFAKVAWECGWRPE